MFVGYRRVAKPTEMKKNIFTLSLFFLIFFSLVSSTVCSINIISIILRCLLKYLPRVTRRLITQSIVEQFGTSAENPVARQDLLQSPSPASPACGRNWITSGRTPAICRNCGIRNCRRCRGYYELSRDASAFSRLPRKRARGRAGEKV